MKKENNAGYSLVEVLVAIVLLGIFVAPTCASLVMGYRMNAKAAQLMDAQLAVSSAVEILMAEGIQDIDYTDYFDGKIDKEVSVEVQESNGLPYHSVKVECDGVTVETTIRKAG